MKIPATIIVSVSLFLLLASCEKDDGNNEVFKDLSTDSLKILQTNIPDGHYTDLTFINKTTGFAVSNFGNIIKTTDGGHSWKELPSKANFFLNRIQFTDNQTGYVIGGDTTGGYLLKTIDAGESWQLVNLHTPGKIIPTGIFFLSNTCGFISGENLFIKTTDGGKTWSEVMGTSPGNINDVCFKDGSTGYATSDNGKYYKTIDGGKTWQTKQSNMNDHLKKIYIAESKPYAKCRTGVFLDLSTGIKAFTVPESAFDFLFLNNIRCIGIGQHYENEFLPYGDVFLTNDAWMTYSQKKFSPQSEAMNVTAVAKTEPGRVIILGCGVINTSVIELRY